MMKRWHSDGLRIFQVIHGLLDRTMQLLEVLPTEDKTNNPQQGYHLKALDGKLLCFPFTLFCQRFSFLSLLFHSNNLSLLSLSSLHYFISFFVSLLPYFLSPFLPPSLPLSLPSSLSPFLPSIICFFVTDLHSFFFRFPSLPPFLSPSLPPSLSSICVLSPISIHSFCLSLLNSLSVFKKKKLEESFDLERGEEGGGGGGDKRRRRRGRGRRRRGGRGEAEGEGEGGGAGGKVLVQIACVSTW